MTNEAGRGTTGGTAGRDLARWVACFLAVLALHGGAALALFAHSAEDDAAGLPTVIPIELAELPTAPSVEPAQDAVPGPEQTQSEASPAEAAEAPPPAAAPEDTPPDPVPPPPLESAEAKPEEPPPPPESLEAKPEEPPPPVAEPVPVPDLKPAPRPEVALAVPPERQKIAPEKPKPREVRKPEKPADKPKPREKRAERQERREEKQERQERQERRQASRMASASATTAPASARSAAARAAAPMGNGGTSSSLPEWKARLAAHLQRNKRYPSEAQASGQGGVATLQFTVNRSGRVTSSRLVQSSGVASLDAETLALIQRAQPLPPPPADVPGAQFSFSVPFRYSMR